MMRRMIAPFALVALAAPAVAAPAPRDLLTQAAFAAPDKASALALLAQAEQGATAVLRQNPNDQSALLSKALAIGYRAKLNKNRDDAMTVRKMFLALAAANPRDPEPQAAVGGWHVDSVASLGGMVASLALGAKKGVGLAALDRAVALSGGRAMFPTFDALMRINLDAGDVANARRLAEQGAKGATPLAIDRLMQRSAAALLVPLRQGDGKAAQALAKKLLPFGRFMG